MSSDPALSLSLDEVDDLLYFTRVNEAAELSQSIQRFAQKYGCPPSDILETCKDPENGNTVFHYCAANGFNELLQSLLLHLSTDGAALQQKTGRALLVNHQNQERNTPLHWAAYNGHLEVVKLLVNSGADMWIKNAAGHLAMFEAERADKNDVVQYLLEAGGKEVERAGAEGQPSAEDIEEVQQGSTEAEPSNGTDQSTAGRMEE